MVKPATALPPPAGAGSAGGGTSVGAPRPEPDVGQRDPPAARQPAASASAASQNELRLGSVTKLAPS